MLVPVCASLSLCSEEHVVPLHTPVELNNVLYRCVNQEVSDWRLGL